MDNHPLRRLLAETITAGLQRKSVTKCSTWASHYRIMGQPFPGPYSFRHHPWVKEMHDCTDEVMVGQKGAQLGFTEVALNKTFYNIDILGNSVLYVLPSTNPDAANFSTSRFDPALELSPHLRNLFSDVKNIGHKRAGSANLFVRGSRSRSQLKSVPVSVCIVDELDEMIQEHIALINERMSGQMEKQTFMLSTPTIEHFGINDYFNQSSQDHWHFPCPLCGKWTQLIFPDCLVITAEHAADPRVRDSHIICMECKGALDHKGKPDYLGKGKWVSTYGNRVMRGFHVSQLYSSTVRPYELALSYLRGQVNPADAQEFFNSKLGLPYEEDGARLSDDDILQCTGQFGSVDSGTRGALITMGVDVGTWLHCEISQHYRGNQRGDVNQSAKTKLLKAIKVKEFEELDRLMHDYGISACVIDANPERRKALEFAKRFWGRVKLCFYGRGKSSRDIVVHAPDQHAITVDRTSWLDMSLGRIRQRRIAFPVDLPHEYKENIKNLVRLTVKDGDGNPVSRYKKTGPDHYAHARNYNELALRTAATMAQSSDIRDPF